MELTMRNLLAGRTDVDRRDFLARAELLAACGMTVLISDYFEYYRLAAYLAWRTKERIGVVLGLPSVSELFDENIIRNCPAASWRISGDYLRITSKFMSIRCGVRK